MYLPLTVGNIVALIFVCLRLDLLASDAISSHPSGQYLVVIQPAYERTVRACLPAPPPPEVRLTAAIWGAPLFAAAIFWFGWTSFPGKINFWVPMMSGFVMGCTLLLLTVRNISLLHFQSSHIDADNHDRLPCSTTSSVCTRGVCPNTSSY